MVAVCTSELRFNGESNMAEIKLTDSIGYADYLHIIFGKKHVTHFTSEGKELTTTFAEVMNIAKKNGYDPKKDGIIILLAESPLSGKVFQYGNYGDFWVEHGTTKGYA